VFRKDSGRLIHDYRDVNVTHKPRVGCEDRNERTGEAEHGVDRHRPTERALDAIGEQGRVVVSARPEGSNVVVRVVDDGHGIADDIKGRIFDPFFTTKPVGSTGLGLDIARRIVRRHEGQIELETRPGRTEFRVVLPAESSVG